MTDRVVVSVNNDVGDHCVDIFVRDDGSFGFAQYRRDHEDQRGWFRLGRPADEAFATLADAMARAKATIPWLSAIVP